MKNKKPIKWLTAGLIMMLVLTANQQASGQDTTNFNIYKSISLSNSDVAAVDSIDFNGDTLTDVYIKIQQWPVSNGPHHILANALLIWGVNGDSVTGGCRGGGFTNNLIPGDTIDADSDWDDFTHPFYTEPGIPWNCDCDCDNEKTTYIGVKFRLRNNAIRYGWIKVDYKKNYFSIDFGAYMNSSDPIIIEEY